MVPRARGELLRSSGWACLAVIVPVLEDAISFARAELRSLMASFEVYHRFWNRIVEIVMKDLLMLQAKEKEYTHECTAVSNDQAWQSSSEVCHRSRLSL